MKTQNQYQKDFLASFDMFFKAIMPWKKDYEVWLKHGVSDQYAKGWNDCLKEIKKRKKLAEKELQLTFKFFTEE